VHEVSNLAYVVLLTLDVLPILVVGLGVVFQARGVSAGGGVRVHGLGEHRVDVGRTLELIEVAVDGVITGGRVVLDDRGPLDGVVVGLPVVEGRGVGLGLGLPDIVPIAVEGGVDEAAAGQAHSQDRRGGQ